MRLLIMMVCGVFLLAGCTTGDGAIYVHEVNKKGTDCGLGAWTNKQSKAKVDFSMVFTNPEKFQALTGYKDASQYARECACPDGSKLIGWTWLGKKYRPVCRF